MSRRNYLTVAILSLTWILSQPLPATAQSQHGVEVFPYPTVDLQLSASSGRALDVNRQRHSNSPFNHISLNLFTDIVAGDRLTVFNHVLVDPSAKTSINSFLRTWARFTVVRRDGFDLHLQLGKIPTPFGHFTERACLHRHQPRARLSTDVATTARSSDRRFVHVLVE